MRFVEDSSYTAIIPNYCRLLARYHFKNHHYPEVESREVFVRLIVALKLVRQVTGILYFR